MEQNSYYKFVFFPVDEIILADRKAQLEQIQLVLKVGGDG